VSDYLVNALRVEVGVNMGDHGQDVTTAVDVRPDDTIDSIVDRYMRKPVWRGGADAPDAPVDPTVRIELRVAIDRDVPTEGGPF
jgi:hypothetical protein